MYVFIAASNLSVWTRQLWRLTKIITLQALLSGTLPTNSAIISYAIEGALLISNCLPKSHAVTALHTVCKMFGYQDWNLPSIVTLRWTLGVSTPGQKSVLSWFWWFVFYLCWHKHCEQLSKTKTKWQNLSCLFETSCRLSTMRNCWLANSFRKAMA